MTPTSFSNPPTDILIAVLTQLKRASETTHDLASCALVNRCWHDATTPLLYGNVALTHDNLIRFSERLEVSKQSPHVRSITILHGQYQDIEATARLVPLLPRLKNLRSFSLCFGDRYHEPTSQTPLVRLVDALPISCTNLELDTQGFDVREEEGEETHLCASLRKVLPRMQHVRLRLRACEKLFTDPSTPDLPIRLPSMKTFIYSCARRPGTPLATCRCPDNRSIAHNDPDLLWYSVTASLEHLISTPGSVPKEAKILAFMITDRTDNDYSFWQAHIRADMQSRSSIALPHRTVWMESSIRGSYLIRLLSGAEMMATPATIETLAEGHLWRDIIGGARLPAAVLADEAAGRASFAAGCVERGLPLLKTSDEWRGENPGKGASHWVSERVAGEKLVFAEERSGVGYLKLGLVREVTPAGWQRGGVGDVLERAAG